LYYRLLRAEIVHRDRDFPALAKVSRLRERSA